MKTALPDFKIRLPQELKTAIEDAAKSNSRSMNGEIIARLEQTFSGEARGSLQKQIDDLRERIQALENPTTTQYTVTDDETPSRGSFALIDKS
ncbi:MAG: Arc family DNA-binding protein [Rhizobium sp.]|nr:Arc family DNA-binding protein [Rhizobium sp.]